MGGFFIFMLLVIVGFAIMFWLIRSFALATPVPPAAVDLFQQLSAGKSVIAAFPPGALDYGIAGWPNTNPYMTQPCILIIGATYIELYNLNGTRVAAYTPDDVIWYGTGGTSSGDPRAAAAGRAGTVALHVYTQGRWFQVFFVPLRENPMRVLGALAQFKTLPQRPSAYTPFSPAPARVAVDGQHTGVARGEKVRLWFSPAEFVVMRGIGEIAKVPAASVRAISAVMSPEGTPLVRISTDRGPLEYVLDEFIPFAIALGEAMGITPLLPADYDAPAAPGLPTGYMPPGEGQP